MKRLRFKKIDAFATQSSSGNPAAVIYLDRLEDLSEAEKLQIARELKGVVSEVGYVSAGSETDYALCYYSSEREVAFCGHATIAILNDIIANNTALHTQTRLTIATRLNRLVVENRYPDEPCVYISAPPPRYSRQSINEADIAAALNIHPSDIDASHPIQIINAGLETVIVPLASLASILHATPSLQVLNDYCRQAGIDIVLTYSSEVAFQESRYRTRVFAPPFGYLEDPATGSGNAAFGHYLLSQGLWTGEKIQLEQNGSRFAPNYVQIFSKRSESNELRVWFGGGAIVRIDGHYCLY